MTASARRRQHASTASCWRGVTFVRPFDNQLTAGGADVAAAALAHRHGRRRGRRESSRSDRSPRPTAARTECPAAAFSGIRFTFDFTPASSFASRRASCGESLTPASSTYSNVIRLRRLQREALARVDDVGDAVFLVERHELAALQRRSARAARSPGSASSARCASRSSAGSRPTVDSVIRRGDIAKPCSSARIRSAFIVSS